MGPRPGTRAYRFLSTDPAWTRAFLRRVAEGLAAAGPPAALLVEELPGPTGPVVAPADGFGPVVERAALGVPGRLEMASASPIPRPPATAQAHVVHLVARSQPDAPVVGTPGPRPWVPREPEPDRLEFPIPPEAQLWVAVQSHWFASDGPELGIRVRHWVSSAGADGGARALAWGSHAAARLSRATGVGVGAVVLRAGRAERRALLHGSFGGRCPGPPLRLPPTGAPYTVERPDAPAAGADPEIGHHVVLLGASGSGKTAYLAHAVARHVAGGGGAVVLDVHGDLAGRLFARLGPLDRARCVVVDTSAPGGRFPGVAALGGGEGPSGEREAAHAVAALRRLSAEGSEVYWGFRLERIFDTFLRLAKESGGGLGDVYDLLTDPRRRDAARLATHRAVAARLLDELPAILARNPEYLAPAAARLAKVALDPRLLRLLDAGPGGLDLDALFAARRPVLFRLPVGELGPEAAGLSASLIAARTLAVLEGRPPGGRPLALALDEVQLLSPRLVQELLADGRKFGLGVLVATQYPDRLAPDVRAAAQGAVGTHLVFRVPRAAAALAGAWVGLGRAEAERVLPALPVGSAVVSAPGGSVGPRFWGGPPAEPEVDASAWSAASERSFLEHGGDADASTPPERSRELDEELLLATLVGAPGGRGPDAAEVVRRVVARGFDGPEALARLPGLVRRGLLEERDHRLAATPAGERLLGLVASTGATRESAEHRALLLEAFRLLAARGARLEILRQGRFDRRLPDGRIRLLPETVPAASPQALAERIDRARGGWAWRYFGGLDVHVEAEVSGAVRSDRVRRDLEKARAAGAFALFLVADPARARRVKELLDRERVPFGRRAVWTLSRAAAVRGAELD